MNRDWIYVIGAGIVEVGWVTGLKHSSNIWEWLLTALAIIVSFTLILKATNNLPVGTVYAVFTGLGTAGTVASDMLLFGEAFQIAKILLIALLLAGVIGLKLITDKEDKQEGEHA